MSLNDTRVLETKIKLQSKLLSIKTVPPVLHDCLDRTIENLGGIKEKQTIPKKTVACRGRIICGPNRNVLTRSGVPNYRKANVEATCDKLTYY